jgi:hypothetical protein
MPRLCLIILLLITTGHCATITPKVSSHRSSSRKKISLSQEQRQRLIRLAHEAVGKSRIALKHRSFRADCSGTIRALFAQARIPLGGILKREADNDVKLIYRFVQSYGRIIKNNPLPGDLVFFHNTYNRNGTKKMDDALTHIGIVEKIDNNIIYFIHHMGKSIIRSRMNIKKPRLAIDPQTKERINHILRRAQGPQRAYTAGELCAGFGRL